MRRIINYLPLLVFSSFVIVLTALLYWLYPGIITDGLYTGLMAFFVGLFAIWLYLRKQIDHKKDAASIILLEVQNAERILPQIKDGLRSSILTNKFLLPTYSWDKYKYLFVRDFDSLEWESITSFYNNCKHYDESVSYNNTFFQKNEEQMRVNMFRIQSNIIKKEMAHFETLTPAGDRVKAVSVAFDKAVRFHFKSCLASIFAK